MTDKDDKENKKNNERVITHKRISTEVALLAGIFTFILNLDVDRVIKYTLCVCVWNFVYNYVDGRVENKDIDTIFKPENVTLNFMLAIFFPITFGFKVSKYLVVELNK